MPPAVRDGQAACPAQSFRCGAGLPRGASTWRPDSAHRCNASPEPGHARRNGRMCSLQGGGL